MQSNLKDYQEILFNSLLSFIYTENLYKNSDNSEMLRALLAMVLVIKCTHTDLKHHHSPKWCLLTSWLQASSTQVTQVSMAFPFSATLSRWRSSGSLHWMKSLPRPVVCMIIESHPLKRFSLFAKPGLFRNTKLMLPMRMHVIVVFAEPIYF